MHRYKYVDMLTNQVRVHKQSQSFIKIENLPFCLVCISKPRDRAHPDVGIGDSQYIIEETAIAW